MQSNARSAFPNRCSQLHAARLFRMLLPRSVGGDEVEPWAYLRAVEEIAARRLGRLEHLRRQQLGAGRALPPPRQRARYSAIRARLVAWGPPNQSSDRRAGRLPRHRQWSFASGCRQAKWMGAHCHVVEPDGSLRLNAAGKPTVRTLLCPVGRTTLLDDTWNVIGMRGTSRGPTP